MSKVIALNAQSEAQLPQVYEAAKKALATCAKIDECKEWADKSAAIASYAKQAEDDTLLKHARKIQVRAIGRMGTLLQAVESGTGSNFKKGQPPAATRRQVAESAGLSEHQQKQAQRVARVPEDEFERLVESDNPPTVTAMAERGKKILNQSIKIKTNRIPEDVRRTGPIFGALERLNKMIADQSPEVISRGFLEHETGDAIIQAGDVASWLLKLEHYLCTQKPI